MIIIQPLWETHPVEYLVRARYSRPFGLGRQGAQSPPNPKLLSSLNPYAQGDTYGVGVPEIDAYRRELEGLPKSDLVKRVKEQRAKEFNAQMASREAKEQRAFYNQPDAVADFDYWAKAAYWTIDESVALSFGRDPRKVSWDGIRPHVKVSEFAKAFEERRELANRALKLNQLAASNIPGFFLAWAERMRIEVEPELTEAVKQLGIQIADWKSAYDEAVKSNASLTERLKSLTAVTNALNDTMKVVVPFSDASPATDEQKTTRAASTRERETMLKLIIGMAAEQYGYDPTKSRTDAAKLISDDLALHGLSVSDDTVRKYLKEASDLLPRRDGPPA